MASFIPIQFISTPYSRPAYVTYNQPSYRYIRATPFGLQDEYDDAVCDQCDGYACQCAYEAALRRAYQEKLLAEQRRRRLHQRNIEQQRQQQQLTAALHDILTAYQNDQQRLPQRQQSPQPQQPLLQNRPSSPVKSPQRTAESAQQTRTSSATPTRRPVSARPAPRVIPIAGWDDNTTQTTNNTNSNSQSTSATSAQSSSLSSSSSSEPTLLTVPVIQTSNLPESSTSAPQSSSSSPVIIEDVPTTPDEDAKEDAVRYEQRIQH